MKPNENDLSAARGITREITVSGMWQSDCEACGCSSWIDREKTTEIVAKALAEKRERCAVIAESIMPGDYKDCPAAWLNQALKIIANRIRRKS